MLSKTVYGMMNLEISRISNATTQDLAILDSYYTMSDDRVDLTELTLLHKNGKVLETVKVHNVKISWDGF
ncbi:hypothetical protein FTE28_05855 [Bacillus licheniformis]|uniref:hypothetical protein n=1 Tax=Bacillus licheniformis TaxID=1402 RepID=UPI00036FA8CD|nr:hypothetical protein [Bacillus licheniformis]PAC91382.1 hypothetical protein CHH99_16620 [Bacillus licheniformis]PAE74066.1 hypothetical protein CHH84_01735 [Bacillus licheniformis]PAV34291.1 hypothetical protein CJD29_18290 [Bacillus licheniformis]QNT72386.1 hypothetical protein FTE28_05855 [Bacillus licheniformis]